MARFRLTSLGIALAAACIATPSAQALETLAFQVSGGNDDLEDTLRRASLLLAAESEGETEAQDLYGAARSEYARLVAAAYGLGYYSPVVSVLIDGREAAGIAPLNAPATIRRIEVRVDPGPAFVFGAARIAPLAPGTELPEGFAAGRPAESGLIRSAVSAAVNGWRGVGFAKVATSSENIVADHARRVLNADIGLNPGPRLRFGRLAIKGIDRMSERRTRKIAGLPEGETYDPEELERSAERLRRTGVFRSVTLEEDERVTSPDLLGITATLVEEKTRRYSLGAEISSAEGATLSALWMHRNLLGGAERLTVSGEVANLGASNSGVDYVLGVTLDRPATLTADTTLSFHIDAARLDEEDYLSNTSAIGATFSHIFSQQLSASVGVDYSYSDVTDDTGAYIYRTLRLPLGVIWNTRDEDLDATEGHYVDAMLTPFVGFGDTDSGGQLKLDARAYRSFGEERRVTFAGRAQAGAVFGSDLYATPRDLLFYSGGGGTVRGQPYQSLGVRPDPADEDYKIGGTEFAALSLEARVGVTKKIGVVGFVDAGYVSASGVDSSGDDFHAGAGLGLRYDTGFGPIRVDVATPVSGDTGDGVQIYVGIGQSF
ncbi:hypothetical protein C5F48_00435 [Cereibacter changlensis JA139]|uniref:Bacterial surface antigen (D15) domain-containing protein n=2 Tax=Cereibacter changlensis TaxID=402884 RepID=A0A2T4K0Y5_9RHOB|nr:BamA/TamA family outer membrane protein [Cereibacter changlensis]PTE23757.1 hypothetical protein C5F48_00435 [Cereibacter changlensis JA139]PZX59036.1 autotransporter secretion outer membrane protein TamA [Cereibacter changlensis]